jgi:rhodanese-related sulfurtransferase
MPRDDPRPLSNVGAARCADCGFLRAGVRARDRAGTFRAMNDWLPWVALALLAIVIVRRVIAMRNRIPGEAARAKVREGALLLDVRTPGEFAAMAIPSAKNVPVHELGSRLSELPRDRPIIVYCASGMRSAGAASFLRKRGFEVHDLGPASAWPLG